MGAGGTAAGAATGRGTQATRRGGWDGSVACDARASCGFTGGREREGCHRLATRPARDPGPRFHGRRARARREVIPQTACRERAGGGGAAGAWSGGRRGHLESDVSGHCGRFRRSGETRRMGAVRRQNLGWLGCRAPGSAGPRRVARRAWGWGSRAAAHGIEGAAEQAGGGAGPASSGGCPAGACGGRLTRPPPVAEARSDLFPRPPARASPGPGVLSPQARSAAPQAPRGARPGVVCTGLPRRRATGRVCSVRGGARRRPLSLSWQGFAGGGSILWSASEARRRSSLPRLDGGRSRLGLRGAGGHGGGGAESGWASGVPARDAGCWRSGAARLPRDGPLGAAAGWSGRAVVGGPEWPARRGPVRRRCSGPGLGVRLASGPVPSGRLGGGRRGGVCSGRGRACGCRLGSSGRLGGGR